MATTTAGAYTLPLTKTLAEHVERTDRVAFPGEPTWARRINGCGHHTRLHMRPGPDADNGDGVWVVWCGDSAPGDRIEIGPLSPHNVAVCDFTRY